MVRICGQKEFFYDDLVKAASDGSCRPGASLLCFSGWAYVLKLDNITFRHKGACSLPNYDSTESELSGFLHLIKFICNNYNTCFDGRGILIFIDSVFVLKSITEWFEKWSLEEPLTYKALKYYEKYLKEMFTLINYLKLKDANLYVQITTKQFSNDLIEEAHSLCFNAAYDAAVDEELKRILSINVLNYKYTSIFRALISDRTRSIRLKKFLKKQKMKQHFMNLKYE